MYYRPLFFLSVVNRTADYNPNTRTYNTVRKRRVEDNNTDNPSNYYCNLQDNPQDTLRDTPQDNPKDNPQDTPNEGRNKNRTVPYFYLLHTKKNILFGKSCRTPTHNQAFSVSVPENEWMMERMNNQSCNVFVQVAIMISVRIDQFIILLVLQFAENGIPAIEKQWDAVTIPCKIHNVPEDANG